MASQPTVCWVGNPTISVEITSQPTSTLGWQPDRTGRDDISTYGMLGWEPDRMVEISSQPTSMLGFQPDNSSRDSISTYEYVGLSTRQF